jgi:hypothetical protein
MLTILFAIYFRLAAPNTPSKVSLFRHFPHYFLRPYDGQKRISGNNEMFDKLNTENYKWLLRPYIAIFESAQAITENVAKARDGGLLTEYIRTDNN